MSSSARGVYILVFRVSKDLTVAVGSLGDIHLLKGLYSYIGSARGPGGIGARISHHIRKGKRRPWWHIDYITTLPEVLPIYVVYAETREDVEPLLAQQMGSAPCWRGAVEGFGSTDRGSRTHLFYCICCEEMCISSIATVFKALGLEPRIEGLGQDAEYRMH